MAVEINAITFVTVDMAASVRFYEVLGFEVAYGGSDEPFTTMKLATNFVNLQHTGAEPGLGWGRVIIHVEDPDAIHAAARTAGYPSATEPADARWGERYFHILDPSGHELSFARRLDDAPPPQSASELTRDVLRRYEHDLYNGRDLSLVPELLADPMERHDAGGEVTVMTNVDCTARIGGFFEQFERLTFRTLHQIIDGPVASWTYELTLTAHDGTESVISSIEVFEVLDGRITRVWNAEHTPGPWSS